MKYFLPFILLGLHDYVWGADKRCDGHELDRCMPFANKLLHDPSYIFPTSVQDINESCKTWKSFVDCVSTYLDFCIKDDSKIQWFKNEVAEPVNAVTEMCTNHTYQTRYLQHAECLNMLTTANEFCGQPFNYLVAQVMSHKPGDRDKETCCSHNKFRRCILTLTLQQCDKDGTRTVHMFAETMLNRAMRVIIDHCRDYIPNDSDCVDANPPLPREHRRIDDTAALPDAGSLVNPTEAGDLERVDNIAVFDPAGSVYDDDDDDGYSDGESGGVDTNRLEYVQHKESTTHPWKPAGYVSQYGRDKSKASVLSLNSLLPTILITVIVNI